MDGVLVQALQSAFLAVSEKELPVTLGVTGFKRGDDGRYDKIRQAIKASRLFKSAP